MDKRLLQSIGYVAGQMLTGARYVHDGLNMVQEQTCGPIRKETFNCS